MLEYNTQQSHLVLPEYGRGIQQMVDHCLTLEDRDQRTRCARSIIKAMATLFPEMRSTEASQRKLWDHLAIMARFQLDIEWPVEPPTADAMTTSPLKVAYPGNHIDRRQYGHLVEATIKQISLMDPGAERDELITRLANQMKKQLMAQGNDGRENDRVANDLADYTEGQVEINPDNCTLYEFNIVAPSTGKKRKKK